MEPLIKNKLGFFGTYKCDIINYLSRILSKLDKKVAVIDASIEQTMRYCIPQTYDGNYVSYRSVDFYINCQAEKSFINVTFDDYDVILIDFGFNKSLLDKLYDCTGIFLISDFQRYNIQRIRAFTNDLKDESSIIRIYRDMVDSKIDSKYIDSYLNIDNFEVIAKYEFELEPQDYKSNIEFQYNDIFKFKDLSKYYKDMLNDIISEYFQIEKKQILKAAKLAERGK
ncbi:hypothetical protein [Abyssisolibacter fermentans]|uniref:hypothetical protein n=1 Tax=Abyssisolibacter fermentans TaxID=1766203 RepID=UPI0012E350B8|nr:hypothetical protein [Abyssisolibacter fermentans]